MLVQFKLVQAGLRLHRARLAAHRLWVKVTPLVKEWHHQDPSVNQDLSEDSVDIQDVRNRSGVWPIVEAAVRFILSQHSAPSDLDISYME